MRRLVLIAAVALIAATAVGAAGPAEPGLSATTILIGGPPDMLRLAAEHELG